MHLVKVLDHGWVELLAEEQAEVALRLGLLPGRA